MLCWFRRRLTNSDPLEAGLNWIQLYEDSRMRFVLSVWVVVNRNRVRGICCSVLGDWQQISRGRAEAPTLSHNFRAGLDGTSSGPPAGRVEAGFRVRSVGCCGVLRGFTCWKIVRLLTVLTGKPGYLLFHQQIPTKASHCKRREGL